MYFVCFICKGLIENTYIEKMVFCISCPLENKNVHTYIYTLVVMYLVGGGTGVICSVLVCW